MSVSRLLGRAGHAGEARIAHGLAGKGIMRVGDEERVVGRGAWVYTPPGLKHYTENTGDVDMAYLFFGGNPTDPDAGFHEPVKEE